MVHQRHANQTWNIVHTPNTTTGLYASRAGYPGVHRLAQVETYFRDVLLGRSRGFLTVPWVGYAGSGSVIYRESMVLHEISIPCGRVSIAYAELFAMLSVLRWLRTFVTSLDSAQVHSFHFFTDSSFARTVLCSSRAHRRFFFLSQEIQHLASSLSSYFQFYIHWIPSHMSRLSCG